MRSLLTVLVAGCAATVDVNDRKPEPRPVEHVEVAPAEARPWHRSWEADAERARLAKIADVRELEAEYVAACGRGVPYQVTGSPLLRHRMTSHETPDGVVIELSPNAGSAERLLDDLRCHLVGIVMAPFGVDDSPFDVPGLRIDARGDASGVTVAVTTNDRDQVAELQRRLREQVDETQRRYHED
jgi:hypothetical protein